MKTATIISKLFLLAFLLMPNAILAQNHTINVNGTQIQVSSTLQTVFDQAEKIYINPIGYKIEDVYHKAPDMIPLFIGLIMQRQKIFMDQTRNIKHLDNYFALQDEILSFMGQFAQAHNYINPIGGSKLSPIQMHKDFKSGLNGDFNNLYINKFGINPTTVNIAYILDHSSNNTVIANNSYNNPTNTDNGFTAIQTENTNNGNVDVRAALVPAKEEVPTEINLFGEVSPYAMGHAEVEQWQDMTGVSSVEGLVCPEKNQSPNTYFFDIDTNNIPNDGTDVRCVYFGKDGPLQEQRPNVNNKQHGVFITYAMNGDVRYLSSKKNYVNGQKHGVQESYTVNDKGRHYLRSIENYVNDKKEGVSKSWNISKNGEIYLEWVSNYSNGKFNGNREFYSTTSETEQPYLFSKTAYVNGEKNGEEIEYRSDGRIESKEIYKNGKRNGECVYYSRSGKISFKCNYINDKEHGQCISYSPRDGITHCITTYENGVKIGEKCFDPKGNIVRR